MPSVAWEDGYNTELEPTKEGVLDVDTINLLVTLDENYLPQLSVLLTSIALNNPETRFDLYLLHSNIPDKAMENVNLWSKRTGNGFFPVQVQDDMFQNAPVSRQYPREMYYRLLAGELLPGNVKRVLYLDPDILVINSLTPLWEMDMGEKLFAAAAHTGKTELANNVNRLRLGIDHDYYNSGVLLMDLKQIRKAICPEQIFTYVKEHDKELILPDQDVLNAMFGDNILSIPDELWNYDARNYNNYLLRSGGICDLLWVMEHTAILHFCGKVKPWKPHYPYRFGILYRHYMQITGRTISTVLLR